MWTLLLTSLVLLSTDHVEVKVIKDEVHHLTKADCHYWMKQWRQGGPRYQAACVKEGRK